MDPSRLFEGYSVFDAQRDSRSKLVQGVSDGLFFVFSAFNVKIQNQTQASQGHQCLRELDKSNVNFIIK